MLPPDHGQILGSISTQHWKVSGVYRILSLKTGRSYIGSAVNLLQRKRQHLLALRQGKHYNQKLQNHYNKYGAEDLRFELMETCSAKLLLVQEQRWIDATGSLASGFNLAPRAASMLGYRHPPRSKAQRREISARMKARVDCTGKNMSQSIRAKTRWGRAGAREEQSRKLRATFASPAQKRRRSRASKLSMKRYWRRRQLA